MTSESNKKTKKNNLLEHLNHFLLRKPENREQLFQLLNGAYESHLIDGDSLAMIEGVLQVSEMQARDIMIPRSQMDLIDITTSPATFIPQVIETAHSRFPVIEDDKNDIVGILLAKDLLRYNAGEEFEVRDMLRPANFIPESKPLNVLLKEFRSTRNHIAIVVDEYGGVAGMVTIEDVLEQIVGDIEDEYDYDEDEDNIIQQSENQYRVKALTEIADFNADIGTKFSDETFDTIGGLVINQFGHLPKKGDSINIENINVTVLRADSRRLHSIVVRKLPEEQFPIEST